VLVVAAIVLVTRHDPDDRVRASTSGAAVRSTPSTAAGSTTVVDGPSDESPDPTSTSLDDPLAGDVVVPPTTGTTVGAPDPGYPPGLRVARDHGPVGLATDITMGGCVQPLELVEAQQGVSFEPIGAAGLAQARFRGAGAQGHHDLRVRCGPDGTPESHRVEISGARPTLEVAAPTAQVGGRVTVRDATGCGGPVPEVLVALWWARDVPADPDAAPGIAGNGSFWAGYPTVDAQGRWADITSEVIPNPVPEGARFLWVQVYCQVPTSSPGDGWNISYAWRYVPIAGT
jgi:hypothetical protein